MGSGMRKLGSKRGKFVTGIVLVACMMAIAVPVQAQAILYGTATGCEDCFEESGLFIIDPTTGDATLVGLTGFDNVTGLADVNGRLLGTARGDDLFGGTTTAILIEINPFTGEGTLIGVVDDEDSGCGRMPGLTFDSVNQILYAYSDSCDEGDEGLYTIDPVTGAGTSVGASGFGSGGNGLAIEPATGTIYATPRDDESLVIIDPATGAGTSVAGSDGNVPRTVNALAFDPVTGILFGSQKQDSTQYNLLVIDTTDGFTTAIGETELGLSGLVFFGLSGGALGAGAGNTHGDSCVVATAAYGTPMASDINVLRQVRDTYLLNTAAGTAFVEAYYTFSPPLADFVAKHPAAATTVRVLLTPVIVFAQMFSAHPMTVALAIFMMTLLVGTGILRRVSRARMVS